MRFRARRPEAEVLERFASEMIGCMGATTANLAQSCALRVCPGASSTVFYWGLPESTSPDPNMPTKRSWIAACAALFAANIAVVPHALAGEEGLKDGAREAGRAIGSGAREVWKGAAKIGKEIGHGAAKAGKAVGSAAAEGGREVKRAFKGEKK